MGFICKTGILYSLRVDCYVKSHMYLMVYFRYLQKFSIFAFKANRFSVFILLPRNKSQSLNYILFIILDVLVSKLTIYLLAMKQKVSKSWRHLSCDRMRKKFPYIPTHTGIRKQKFHKESTSGVASLGTFYHYLRLKLP